MKILYENQDRRFIGKNPHEYGTISWGIVVDSEGGWKNKPTLDANVRMTDCNKIISWDFSVGDYADGDWQERLNKLDNVLKSLELFKDSLIDAISVYQNQYIKWKEDQPKEETE